MNSFIIEYLSEQPYLAVIIGTSYESPYVYIKDVEKELHSEKLRGWVLFDMLLHSGNGPDRFFTMEFDGKHFNKVTVKNVKLERLNHIRREISKVLADNPEVIENSILNRQQKALLLHRCCL